MCPPIYEFRHREASDCPEPVEAFQKVSEAPLRTCPECGGGIYKIISRPRFQFKKYPKSEKKLATRHYEKALGRKVEKDESFMTIPASGEVLEMKGLTRKLREEKVHAAHLKAGTPGVTEASKIEEIG
jgi:putative FmdB family regulatory protein